MEITDFAIHMHESGRAIAHAAGKTFLSWDEITEEQREELRARAENLLSFLYIDYIPKSQ